MVITRARWMFRLIAATRLRVALFVEERAVDAPGGVGSFSTDSSWRYPGNAFLTRTDRNTAQQVTNPKLVCQPVWL